MMVSMKVRRVMARNMVWESITSKMVIFMKAKCLKE